MTPTNPDRNETLRDRIASIIQEQRNKPVSAYEIACAVEEVVEQQSKVKEAA